MDKPCLNCLKGTSAGLLGAQSTVSPPWPLPHNRPLAQAFKAGENTSPVFKGLWCVNVLGKSTALNKHHHPQNTFSEEESFSDQAQKGLKTSKFFCNNTDRYQLLSMSLPGMQEIQIQSRGQEDALERGMQLTPVFLGASLVAPLVKNPPAVQETWVQFLGQENSLEKG